MKKIFMSFIFIVVLLTGVSCIQTSIVEKREEEEEFQEQQEIQAYVDEFIPIYTKEMVRPDNSVLGDPAPYNNNAAFLADYMGMGYVGDVNIITTDAKGNTYEYTMSLIEDYSKNGAYGVYKLDYMNWDKEENIHLINSDIGNLKIEEDSVNHFKSTYREIVENLRLMDMNNVTNQVDSLSSFCEKNNMNEYEFENIALNALYETYGGSFAFKNTGVVTQENGMYYARYIYYNLIQDKYESIAINLDNKIYQITPFYFR